MLWCKKVLVLLSLLVNYVDILRVKLQKLAIIHTRTHTHTHTHMYLQTTRCFNLKALLVQLVERGP